MDGAQPRQLTSTECAAVLRGLAEPLRLQILALLREGPMPVHQITDRLSVRQYQASRHLGALYDLGLLTRERRARSVFYALSAPAKGLTADGKAPDVGLIELGCCQVCIK